MSALPKWDEYVSEEEYFRILEASEERLDWMDGRIYPKNNPYGLLPEAMAGASDPHIDIAGNTYGALWNRLRGKECHVVSQDQKVKSARSYSFPDLTVYCGDREKDDKGNLTNPVVIIEVLSPGTQDYDRGEKFDRLSQLPSFQDYLLIWQDRLRIEHRHRKSENRWDLIFYNSLEDEIDLVSIGVTLPLSEIYERITFE